MPRASSLAAEIKKSFGIEPVLERGSGGIFDVTIDGQLLFSKYELDRFPKESEVLEKIAELRR